MATSPVDAQVALWGIHVEGWLTILAIVAGPILALIIQRELDNWRAHKQRKLHIFKDLMATRASRLSPRHVEALNAIEIEFSGAARKETGVFDAWRLYLNHLNNHPGDGSGEAPVAAWQSRAQDLFFQLLFEMSKALGFKYDEASLRSTMYSPVAHGAIEQDQNIIRKSLAEILDGKRPIPVSIVAAPTPTSPPQAPTHKIEFGTSASGFRR